MSPIANAVEELMNVKVFKMPPTSTHLLQRAEEVRALLKSNGTWEMNVVRFKAKVQCVLY